VPARTWPLLKLPRWLIGYVVCAVGCYVAAIVAAISVTSFRIGNIELCCALLLFGVLSVEFTRRYGETAEFTKSVHGIWHIPLALLLPPVYALLAPIVKMSLMQLRVNRKPLYRRAFTAASQGLSYAAMSVIFHTVAPSWHEVTSHPVRYWVAWVSLALGCAALQSAVNTAVVAVAAKGANPAASIRSLGYSRDPLYNDLAEVTAGTMLAALIAATSTWLIVALALPMVTLLHRSLRHAQLTNAARIDAKTSLLNAATWHEEARAELNRARAPVTLAILDIDHFKQVNDSYGHVTGDNVLAALAGIMRSQLRDYDIAGRFGGEEFTILFPRTTAADAVLIAERLRAAVASMAFPAGNERAAHITVSIGLTSTDTTDLDLDELIIAADAALYRAKGRGRDQVCALP
jgi:diguanylate cyclase (GGDEF)-like protein